MSEKQSFTELTTVRLDNETSEMLEKIIDKKRRLNTGGKLKGRQDILRLIIALGMNEVENNE